MNKPNIGSTYRIILDACKHASLTNRQTAIIVGTAIQIRQMERDYCETIRPVRHLIRIYAIPPASLIHDGVFDVRALKGTGYESRDIFFDNILSEHMNRRTSQLKNDLRKLREEEEELHKQLDIIGQEINKKGSIVRKINDQMRIGTWAD